MSTEHKESRYLLSAIVGFLLVSLSLLAVDGAFFWYTTGHMPRGVLESTDDWPYAMQQLLENLRLVDPSIEMDGYLMYGMPGPYSVSEAAFRIHDASPQVLIALKTELQLVPIQSDHQMAGWGRIVVEKVSEDWWVPLDQDGSNIFASQHLLDGGEGDLYVIAHEPATNSIYISYHFNF